MLARRGTTASVCLGLRTPGACAWLHTVHRVIRSRAGFGWVHAQFDRDIGSPAMNFLELEVVFGDTATGNRARRGEGTATGCSTVSGGGSDVAIYWA